MTPQIIKEVHMWAILWMRIKIFRKKRKLTQLQLSRLAEIDYHTLRKMEQWFIKEPSFFKVLSLINALQMDIADLYSPHDETKNPSVIIKKSIA